MINDGSQVLLLVKKNCKGIKNIHKSGFYAIKLAVDMSKRIMINNVRTFHLILELLIRTLQ